MIVTVTPNAGLDLTYQLAVGDRLSDPLLEVHRATAVSLEASGKGVNVSRAMTLAGIPSTAVLFAGGRTGSQLLELLDAEGVPHAAVAQSGATRVNTTVLSPGGPTVKLNAPGAVASPAELDRLVRTVDAELARHSEQVGYSEQSGQDAADWLLICGSMPPGVDPAVLVDRLISVAKARGWRVCVDGSGPGLTAAFEAGADLLAPNATELIGVLGLEPIEDGAPPAARALLAAAAAEADRRGCQLLVSLGPDGAGWTDGRRTLHARGPVVVPVNSAGAGDALLAGWFFADSIDPVIRLATAVAWGTAACLSSTTVAAAPSGGILPSIDSIQVSDLGALR